MKPRTVRLSAAAAALGAVAAVLAVAAPLPDVLRTLGDLPTGADSLGPDTVAMAVAGAGCWAALAWLLLALLVVGVGSRPGRCGRLARGVAVVAVPRGLRRVLAVGIGLAVVTSTAAPALATGPGPRPSAIASAVDLDWPVSRTPPAVPPAGERVVVVRPGDTLWAIAARRLPTGAPASAIAAAWPGWYAANRHLIGPDPDRLLPGQRLTPPSPSPGGSS